MVEQSLKDRIVQVLAGGPRTNQEIRTALGFDPTSYDTQTDRMLQKLKKAARIEYVDRAWQLTDMTICPCCRGHGLVTNAQAKAIESWLD